MNVTMNLAGDLSQSLEQLADGMREHVVRSAARAGALVFYDEAKRQAPVHDGAPREGVHPGQLRNAIYHAFADAKSGELVKVYEVSWNAAKAPHGHLIENGHWRVNKLVQGSDGRWIAARERLERPVWVPPVAFIRRSFDRANAAVEAMQRRAAERTAEVLAGRVGGGD